MREIEGNVNRWKDIPCSWIGRINTAKMNLLLKAVYRFSAISIKIPMAVSAELEQRILKFCMEIQKALIDNIIFRKNRAGGITLPDFRLYYKSDNNQSIGTETDVKVNGTR